jgi:hypothetical protein
MKISRPTSRPSGIIIRRVADYFSVFRVVRGKRDFSGICEILENYSSSENGFEFATE